MVAPEWNKWCRSRLLRIARLGGYVAFDIPRVVTVIGNVLLSSIVATHVYVWSELSKQTVFPRYFVVYLTVLIGGCLVAVGASWLHVNPLVPKLSWIVGSALSLTFLGLYVASRMVTLNGLTAVTGRWDCAPGTFALASAAGFVAVHMSVLSGINVAYPQRRNWTD